MTKRRNTDYQLDPNQTSLVEHRLRRYQLYLRMNEVDLVDSVDSAPQDRVFGLLQRKSKIRLTICWLIMTLVDKTKDNLAKNDVVTWRAETHLKILPVPTFVILFVLMFVYRVLLVLRHLHAVLFPLLSYFARSFRWMIASASLSNWNDFSS